MGTSFRRSPSLFDCRQTFETHPIWMSFIPPQPRLALRIPRAAIGLNSILAIPAPGASVGQEPNSSPGCQSWGDQPVG